MSRIPVTTNTVSGYPSSAVPLSRPAAVTNVMKTLSPVSVKAGSLTIRASAPMATAGNTTAVFAGTPARTIGPASVTSPTSVVVGGITVAPSSVRQARVITPGATLGASGQTLVAVPQPRQLATTPLATKQLNTSTPARVIQGDSVPKAAAVKVISEVASKEETMKMAETMIKERQSIDAVLHSMFKLLESDQPGFIGIDAFVPFERMLVEEGILSESEFEKFDADKDGKATLQEFVDYMKKCVFVDCDEKEYLWACSRMRDQIVSSILASESRNPAQVDLAWKNTTCDLIQIISLDHLPAGFINLDMFRYMMSVPNYRNTRRDVDEAILDIRECNGKFEELDSDSDGKIPVDEVMLFCKKLTSQMPGEKRPQTLEFMFTGLSEWRAREISIHYPVQFDDEP